MMAASDSDEVAEEYRSSLKDLMINSKPLITMLTMLADENRPHAAVIVKVIEEHIQEVSGAQKLPVMYLIDSIMKNVGQDYIKLFGHNIINTFSCVFEKVDERTRKKLYELRHTWNEVFPKSRLYGLDVKVQSLDPAWPLPTGLAITSQSTSKPNIHINPNIIKPGVVKGSSLSTSSSSGHKSKKDLEILKREEQILELERQKLMLEKKKILLEQSRQAKSDIKLVKAEPEKPVVSSTIHVDPRRVHQVLPVVAASNPVATQDPRRVGDTTRDPRLIVENNRDPRIALDGSRDPRLNIENSRDPRLISALSLNSTKTAKSSEVPVLSSRDPRVANSEPVKKDEEEKEKREKEREKEREKKEKEKEREKERVKEREIEKEREDKEKREIEKVRESKEKKEKEREKEKDKEKEKEKEKERIKEQKKKLKESPSKVKKEKEVKPVKSETRSTRSIHRAKDKEKKEKESPMSSSSPKPDVGQIKKPLEVPTPDTTEHTTTFKSNRRNKQRTYKQRDESPERAESPPRRKRSHEETLSDSDDSDHYEANRPNPALYNKPAKKPEASTPPASAASSTGIGDTDYRQFTSPPKRPATDENISPPKPDNIIDEKPTELRQDLGLFSKKDVDYRQLLPRPGLLPNPGLPSAFNTMDQDDRNPSNRDQPLRDPLAPLNTSENQASKVPHSKEMDTSGMESPLTCSVDPRMRKHSFNSPHAASWEKFREKNPEFKEYQRQASMSESDRSFLLDDEDQDMAFCDSQHEPLSRGHSFRSRGYGDWRDRGQSRHKDGRRPWSQEEEDSLGPQGRSKAAQENFKMILKQALEQRDRGEISEAQYQDMANKLRLLTEQEQIREARERERLLHRNIPLQFQGDGDWSGSEGPTPVTASGLPSGTGSLGPGGPGLGPCTAIPGTGRGRGSREAHLTFPQGARGSRGAFLGASVPAISRGMGRAGRGSSGTENDAWGRGGMRGRGRRGRGGQQLDDNSWVSKDDMLEDEWTGEPDLPFVTEETLKAVARDAETRTIEIDGVPREIRTYGENAVILLDWDDPRILTFGEGHCNIVFDEGKFVLPMRIGEDYKEFTIAGETHRIKLGVPTQELMLDGRGYQCFFGGKPITVHLAGQPRIVSLDSKPPNVNISPVRNTEFLAGKIQLVINAKKVVNLFLDAKPQRFNIDGKPFIIQFVDALRAVAINNVKFPVEFGGLPLSISVRGYRRFLRFTSLPKGIIPGQIIIRGMELEGQKLSSLPGSPAQEKIVENALKVNRGSPALDMSRQPPMGYPADKTSSSCPTHASVGMSSMPEGVFIPHQVPPPQGPASQGLPPQGLPQRPLHSGPPPHGPPPHGPPHQGPPPGPPPPVSLCPGPMLSQAPPAMALPSGIMPVTTIGSQLPPQPGLGTLPVTLANMNHPPPNTIPGSYITNQLPPTMIKPSQPTPHVPLDLNALLENLTRTGLIDAKAQDKTKGRKEESEKKKEEEEEEKEKEKDELISFEFMFNLENLRKRRKWLIECLYRGMQCSSCGLRYPPEQTLQYSHHLDWHFRQNRRQQESTKKANTRRFYFSTEDWLQYEEIEDVEERVPSMFESENLDETIQAEEAEEPSVAVSSEATLGVCPTCHDTFSQFFHQETEEWRYHNAVQVDGVNYHPTCHQDMLRAEAAEKEAAEKAKEEQEKIVHKKEKEDIEDKAADDEIGKMTEKTGEEEDKEAEKAAEKDVEGSTEEVPMDSQGSVTEKLEEMSLEPQPAVRIKEEPMEIEEIDIDCITSSQSLPEGMMVKLEVKQEPANSIDDDDLISRSPEDEDISSMLPNESNEELQWEPPIMLVNAAETDIASSIDGNTELSVSDTTHTNTTVTKIKFNMSKPTLNNNNNNENVNEKNKLDNSLLNSSSIEEEVEEFVPPPFTVDYNLKPSFKDVELIEQPSVGRGVELSGLCTIM
ncbi:pre-mRNA cleavage complex 2 protein Pcf11 isoform X4 [Cherax quadricarinatus]|uniref:pre-mRNA cleavage complex 2 protein Pcf11 isoform X4 n=1 Tax=Cherax quadricarinatus TaxID=27406 RepID=UPI00387E6B5B